MRGFRPLLYCMLCQWHTCSLMGYDGCYIIYSYKVDYRLLNKLNMILTSLRVEFCPPEVHRIMSSLVLRITRALVTGCEGKRWQCPVLGSTLPLMLRVRLGLAESVPVSTAAAPVQGSAPEQQLQWCHHEPPQQQQHTPTQEFLFVRKCLVLFWLFLKCCSAVVDPVTQFYSFVLT